MTNFLDQRGFLKSAGFTAAGSLSLRSGAAAQSENKSKAASPRFFSGCCAYSYRKYLEKGPMTMEDFILKAVELGIDGVDLTTYYLKSTEPSYLLGLPLSSKLARNCGPAAESTREVSGLSLW